MKSRETKQKDLVALTESLQNSKSAMVVSFSKLTVTKDQEFRHSLRDAGANYQVVKNTLARIAVKGTQFEETGEYFKGVTAIAWTDNDPIVLTKTISKFLKDNSDVYNFKTGVLDGKVIDFTQLQSIANLPSKEELISKLLFVLSSPAQRLVTVINAVPRDLAVLIKQIGDQKEVPPPAMAETVTEVKAEEAAAPAIAEVTAPQADEAGDASAVEAQSDTAAAPVVETAVEETPSGSVEAGPAQEAGETVEAALQESAEAVAEPAEEVPAAEVEAVAEAPVVVDDESSDDILEIAPEAEAEEKAK